MNKKKIYIPSIVGAGYGEYWRFKGRFRVCKGSRASKKSKTTALNFIIRIIKYNGANLLVVRKTYQTLKDSCFAELRWAIGRLGVESLFDIKTSPLEITYIKTGQKIYFRGLDDPLKITSITVRKGVLCWLWIEEAYEIDNEGDFDILQESIRGAMPKGLFKQITITFNPWNEKHWLKRRFFDCDKNDDILAITTNYTMNEWLDEADKKMFLEMKKNNPKRYEVAGLGKWGVTDGLIYERYVIQEIDIESIKMLGVRLIFGLDFGYTNDPTALFCGAMHIEKREIYVFDELYEKALTNLNIYNHIVNMGYENEVIVADSSEPKSIDEIRSHGVRNICKAKKGRDSVNNGIQFIQNFNIIISPRCKNFLNEIENYAWEKDDFGKSINKPMDKGNHLLDAMRYAMEGLYYENRFEFY